MILGVKDNSAATTALLRARNRPAWSPLVGGNRNRSSRVDGHWLRDIRLQVGEGIGQVAGMDFLVGGVLVAHHPAVWRGRRRRDEEQFVGLGGLEQLLVLAWLEDWGWLAEVDSGSHVAIQQAGVLEHLADGDCVVFAVEGADDAAHGWEGGERV